MPGFGRYLGGGIDASDDSNDPPTGNRPKVLASPEHVHSREFPFGNATVFYPEATESARTVVILLDVDPVGMVRGRGGKGRRGGAVRQRTTVRCLVVAVLLSVVLSRWFDSALGAGVSVGLS